MLQEEESLTWELDICQNSGGWLIDASMARVGASGTTTMLQVPDKNLPTFADLEREVPLVLRSLYEAGTEILRRELRISA